MNKNTFTNRQSSIKPSSDIFVINGESADITGIEALLALMGKQGFKFYQSNAEGETKGKAGLIAKDDVIIIKVNSQWDQRGGTNTDLLKSLINAIIRHPDEFMGEIVIADNGQAQYGSTGMGGNFGWAQNNARNIAQSPQKVADSFVSHNVSTYLWDKITTNRVKEYSKDDSSDGYIIVEDSVNPSTGFIVSYPKFRTKYGTYISLKNGIWDDKAGKYNNNLKIINLPTLKTHFIYGVTACIKHYMGVVSDKLTTQLGASSHNLVGTGAMGIEMAGSRFPAMNIIDAVWVNAKPAGGPWTTYDMATRADLIIAGTDPVSLDYWASKNVLMRYAKEAGLDTSTMDPDNTSDNTFGKWLRLAMLEIQKAGYASVIEDSKINLYVSDL